MKEKLYNLPQYYNIAFSWDLSKEIKLFQELFNKYIPFEVKNILEPACGTGRFLVCLPKYGYHITGYDNNISMIDYAKKQITNAGFQNKATAIVEDMKTARFKEKFDIAINSINSLGYLLSDNDIIKHFYNTGESLKKEGIYIVHLACAWNKLKTNEDEGWIMERDRIRVKTIWGIEKEEKQKKLSYQVCKMEIDDNGKNFILEDHHILRLWFFSDLINLIHKSGKFKLEAIYDENHKQIPPGTLISGELGNLYYILKVI